MSPKPTVVMDTTQKYSESAAAGGPGDGAEAQAARWLRVAGPLALTVYRPANDMVEVEHARQQVARDEEKAERQHLRVVSERVQAEWVVAAVGGGGVDDLILLALSLLLPLPLKGLDALVRVRARDQGLLQLFQPIGFHFVH